MELDSFSGVGGSADDQPTTVVDLVQSAGMGSRGLQRSSEFTVSIPEAGQHGLLIKFANGWKQERSAILEIAGLGSNELKFPPTGSWSSWETKLFTVDLPAGEIVLSIVNVNEAGPEIADVHLNARSPLSRGLAIGDDAITAMSTAGIAALALALKLDEVHSKQEPEANFNESRAVSDELSSPEADQDASQLAQNQNATSTPEGGSSEDPDVHPGSSSPIVARAGNGSAGSSSMAFATIANPEIPGLDFAPRGGMPGGFGAPADDGRVQPMQLGSDAGTDGTSDSTQTPPSVIAPEDPGDTDDTDTDAPAVDAANEGFQPMRLEAELATRGNSGGTQTTTPTVITAGNPGNTATDNANADAASGDAYVDFAGVGSNFNSGSGEYIEWTFEVPEAGVYDLAFGYAFNSGATVDRPMNLKVNGQLWDRLFEMPATAANTTYSEALTRVTLQEGVNTVRLTATGYSGANLDYLDVRPADPGRIVVQAESLLAAAAPNVGTAVNRPITLPYLASNTASEQFRAGAEGDSYLDWGSAANLVTIPVTAAVAGTYEIVITYANGAAAARNLQLLASDDALLGTFNFSPTAALPAYFADYLDIPANLRPTDGSDAGTVPDPTGWESWRKEKLSVSVHLEAGANLFKLSGTNGPNIDKIEFILVDADNSAPEAEAFAVAASEDTAVVIDVAEHIGDIEGDALTVSAQVPVTQGTVSVSGTVITFTPAAHFNGEATISYTVADPSGLTSTANIVVTVAAVNDAPAMLDMWTDVFASPGWRTTGTGAGHFLVAPAGWRPDLRDRFDEFKLPEGTQRIDAPTPYVWIIGRTKTDGPSDYDAVHKVQDGYKVTPLSEWGKEPKPVEVKVDPSIDMKTPPKTQVDTASAEAYFAYAAELLKLHPPHLTDQPILARMKRIGIEPGKSFDLSKADPVVQKALSTVARDAQALMAWKVKSLARVADGWSMNTDTMGVYGNYYLKRAVVAQLGLGANLPQDAIYPLNLVDEDGQPLDGKHNYVIHFDKSEIPPAKAFWSITLYDDKGFQVANGLNRFAVSSWMPFQYNADGSLDLYFQTESPGKDKEWNWLPAPAGPYNLTMRLYAPASEALTGKWNPPPVVKTSVIPPLAAQ